MMKKKLSEYIWIIICIMMFMPIIGMCVYFFLVFIQLKTAKSSYEKGTEIITGVLKNETEEVLYYKNSFLLEHYSNGKWSETREAPFDLIGKLPMVLPGEEVSISFYVCILSPLQTEGKYRIGQKVYIGDEERIIYAVFSVD